MSTRTFEKGDRVQHAVHGAGTVVDTIHDLGTGNFAGADVAFDLAATIKHGVTLRFYSAKFRYIGAPEVEELIPIDTKKDSVPIGNALAFKIDDKVWHEEFGEGEVLGRVWSPSQDCWIAIDVKFGPHNYIRFHFFQQEELDVHYIDELELADSRALEFHEIKPRPTINAHSFKLDDIVFHPKFNWGTVSRVGNDIIWVTFNPQEEPIPFHDGTKCTSPGLHLLTELSIEPQERKNMIRSTTNNTADVINNPAHYTATKIEPIDVIETWGLGFHLGNCVKYIARHGKKDPSKTLEDLKKARWYLDRYINKLEESSKVSE